jgi:hypothetical protein
MRIAIQAESKLSQIRQSPAKPGQRKSKKRAWISFDFLVRIEPFQRVMLTPWAKKFFCLRLAAKNVTRLAIGAQPPLFRMSRPATHDRRASRPAPRGLSWNSIAPNLEIRNQKCAQGCLRLHIDNNRKTGPTAAKPTAPLESPELGRCADGIRCFRTLRPRRNRGDEVGPACVN